MSDSKRKLAKDLSQSTEYRDIYGAEYSNEYVATQIRMLRKARELTQDALGKRIGSNQGRISLFEDSEYGKWSLDTLRKLAGEFGLWLKISFEPFSALIQEATAFDPANLTHPPFENDADVQRWLCENPSANPMEAARATIAAWAAPQLDVTPNLRELVSWLEGRDLPGFDAREQTPAQYLLETIPVGDKNTWDAFATGLSALLIANPEDLAPEIRNVSIFQRNLFGLAMNIPDAPRLDLQNALDTVYIRLTEEQGALGSEALSGLVAAMIHNQADDRWMQAERGRIWRHFLLEDGHPYLPGNTTMGIRGLLGLPDSPSYWPNLASGIRDLEQRFLWQDRFRPIDFPNILDELESAVSLIFNWWAEPVAAQNLLRASLDDMRNGWAENAIAAWAAQVLKLDGWPESLWTVEDILERESFAGVMFTGLAWYRDWKKACETVPISRVRNDSRTPRRRAAHEWDLANLESVRNKAGRVSGQIVRAA